MKGTYTLLGENFQNTSATISLYIRISCLGKCVITEITCIESTRKSFYDDHKNHENYENHKDDEKNGQVAVSFQDLSEHEKVNEFQSYFSEYAKLKKLENHHQDYIGLPSVLREKFIEKEATDLASN